MLSSFACHSSISKQQPYIDHGGLIEISEFKSCSVGDVPFSYLSAASTPLLSGHQGSLSHPLPSLPRCRISNLVPQASNDVPYSFRFPLIIKQRWRTSACFPYLMPLRETWMYAETAYHLHPFLEDFEFLTYPFLGAIGSLPSWFLMAIFFFFGCMSGGGERERMASLF